MYTEMRKSFLIGSALLASVVCGSAVQSLQLSIESEADVVLRWPSSTGQRFIVAYRTDLQPGTEWAFLHTAYAAASTGVETTYTHANVVVYPPPTQGTGGGGSPPVPGSSSAELGVWTPWDRWIYEGRQPYLYEIERRPPYPWDSDVWLIREQQSRSVYSSSPQSPNALPPVGSTGFYFVTEYEEDLDSDGLPNGTEIYLGTHILRRDSDGDNISDGAEDSDLDGDDNFTEYIQGSDPLTDDAGPLPPLTTGGVYGGEFTFAHAAAPGAQIILGPMLFCNNNITADSLVTTQPSPGTLRLSWNSTFVHYEPFFVPQEGPEGAGNPLTDAERNALRDAFGQGTSMDGGRISTPNQAKVDQLPQHVLDYAQDVASEALRKEFQLIQEVNSGLRSPPPGMSLEQYMKVRVNQIHTQFTRLQVVNDSLFRRFGRAVNRILPFLGGILVLANADTIAADFLSASRDYARDVAFGDDETGSAAILSGRCNDLAPGSGNIVLNHLLR